MMLATLLNCHADLTEKYELTYDAWNRIVSVESANGQTTLVAEYQYDGRNHRLIKKKYDGSGNLASTVDYFYNAQWQCLEEQETPVGGSTVTTEYVWGLQYIDDLIARDIGSNRLYAMQAKQFKMVALSDTSGSVVERYSYTPYGETVIYDASFNVRSSSSYDWVYLYTGRRLDEETGLYYFRNRYYHAELGRFCSRDPIGYEDGMSLYRAYFVINSADPSGTSVLPPLVPVPNYSDPCDLGSVHNFCAAIATNVHRRCVSGQAAAGVYTNCMANAAIQCAFSSLVRF